MFSLIISVILGLGFFTAIIWWHYIRDRMTWGEFFKALALELARLGGDLWHRLLAWLQHRFGADTTAAAPPPPAAAPPPPAPAPPPLMPVPTEPGLPPLDGAVIPLEWAALASRVAAFEPESDTEFIQFIQGEMAGMLAHAEGWQAQSETLLTVVGLDPNATEAVTALGEVLADVAHDYGMVVRRFMAVYGQIQAAVADGVILPYNARTWLTGEGAA